MINKTKYLYKILYDLPKVPEKFLNINIESNRENTVVQVPHYDIHNRLDKQTQNPEIKGYWSIEELEKWRDNNIGYSGRKLMCREVLVKPKSNFYLPHVDNNRQFVVLYNLVDSGGELCFWQERNMELYRDPSIDRLVSTDYSKLTLIDSVKIPPFTWYIVNSQVLHSVENLTGPRKTIQFKVKATDPIVQDNLVLL